MIASKVFAVWITNIVCRNIFQIKFKYWSSSLNLVPHVKDWDVTWWHNQMETFATLQVLCAGSSPVTGGFPAQRPVTWSFDVFFDLRLNKLLSKQLWGWWFETLLCPSWSRSNESWVSAVLEACGVNLYQICLSLKKKKKKKQKKTMPFHCVSNELDEWHLMYSYVYLLQEQNAQNHNLWHTWSCKNKEKCHSQHE